MTSTPNTPAGWYTDPSGGPRLRWWDGTAWTENFQEPYSAQAAILVLKAPEGTRPYTVWIWLIVLLPFLGYLPLLFIDWAGYFRFDLDDPSATYEGQFAMMTSPWYLVLTLGSWALFALMVIFGYLDWKELGRRGVPRPFHWAWSFLSIVYPIGRSVVIKRRTGTGIAPMWVAVASIAFGFVVGIYVTAVIVGALLAQVPFS